MKKTISWILRIIAAVILLQTLFFKFSASEESVYIFSTLGMEPWGRIGSGVAELIASLLLLWPRTIVLGALLALGVMAGALVAHLTKLGIEVLGDKGYLFVLCLVVLSSSVLLLFMHRDQLKSYYQMLFGKQDVRVNRA